MTCAAQLLLAGARRALTVGAAAVAAGVVLVGGFGVGTAMLQERVGSITRVADAPDQSVTDRYTMWAAAVGMWRERPLTGVGLAEQGLIGLLALAGSWLALLVLGLRRLRAARRSRRPGQDCALVACGLLVWQLTDFAYADIGGPSTVLTAVCFGLAAWWGLGGGTGAGAEAGSGAGTGRGEVPAS